MKKNPQRKPKRLGPKKSRCLLISELDVFQGLPRQILMKLKYMEEKEDLDTQAHLEEEL